MDNPADVVSLLIIAATALVSFRGFSDFSLFDRYLFDVERILGHREAYRVVTSGFLHANWPHLIFNMYALYTFGGAVGAIYGIFGYCLIYFGSLVAGSLLALYLRRDDEYYRAVGASGAVSGVVFAYIVADPGGSITFVFIPVLIPAWLFGIGFVLISIFGIASRGGGAGARPGGIGHEAHLGGAVSGIGLALVQRPEILVLHPLVVAAIVLPMALLLYVARRRPELLSLRDYIGRRRGELWWRRDEDRRSRLQRDMDRLLDKVNERGIAGLSGRERERLRRISEEKKRIRH